MASRRAHEGELLLGEWACLGILAAAPAHGFAVAALLRPEAEVGRVWSMSRALTYRALDQLVDRGLVHEVATEPGIAGGDRTVLGPTRSGRSRFRTWVTSPTEHLRDLRSEFLLKLVLAERSGIDTSALLLAQHRLVEVQVERLDAVVGTARRPDAVALWRSESAHAALRFLRRLRPQ
jgi:DNA-binding PadR family transcriptional regulator